MNPIKLTDSRHRDRDRSPSRPYLGGGDHIGKIYLCRDCKRVLICGNTMVNSIKFFDIDIKADKVIKKGIICTRCGHYVHV